MKIFRVESANGKGPFYMSGNVGMDDRDAYADIGERFFDMTGIHQTPSFNMQNQSFSFGCTSLEDLAQWFCKEMLDILKKYEYSVSVYNVKTVVRHADSSVTNQIAFKKKNAILVETLALDTLRV